jgi:hypothetical protein
MDEFVYGRTADSAADGGKHVGPGRVRRRVREDAIGQKGEADDAAAADDRRT